jgi:hypothetical protein
MVTRLLVLALLAPIWAGGAAAAEPSAIGQIKSVEGEAWIESPAGRRAAEVGADVRQQDVLVTGADGSIGVTFLDDTRFSAGPDSRIALQTFAYDPTTRAGAFTSRVERGTLAVTSGKLAKSSPDAMNVVTRASILGVRGTRFLVRVAD